MYIFTPLYMYACVCIVGLWLRRPPREREVPGSNPTSARIFSGSNTSDFMCVPGAWRYVRWDWSARCQYTVTG